MRHGPASWTTLRAIATSCRHGIDEAQAALKPRAALCVDDPDVAELATLLTQAQAAVDRIEAHLPVEAR